MYILCIILYLPFSYGFYSSYDDQPPEPERYDVGVYALQPQEEKIILQQDTGFFPSPHNNYLVHNIGKGPIWAEIKYGTKIKWHDVLDGKSIQPGEKTLLSHYDSSYFVSALRMVNPIDKERAIVIVSTVKGYPKETLTSQVSSKDFDSGGFAQFLLATIADNIPVIGATLSHCIEFFWPEEDEDVWDEIKDHVSELIDSKILSLIDRLLDNNLRQLRRRVKTIDRNLRRGISGSNITAHYMNVARSLVGTEEAFRFKSSNDMDVNKVNYAILPLYSTVITMKLLYYKIGIMNKDELGLRDRHISEIKSFAEETLDGGSLKHIYNVYQERMEYEYQNCEPSDLFNALATVKTFTAVSGLEFIPLWEQWIHDLSSNSTPYRDTVLVSDTMGKTSTDLLQVAKGGQIGIQLIPELIEKQINGTIVEVRDRLDNLIIQYDDEHIKAIETTFNQTVFHMGTTGPKKEEINLEKRYLKKIVAFGEDAINGLNLTLSDGTTKSCGNTKINSHRVFELDKHHVVGIFAGHDIQIITSKVRKRRRTVIEETKIDVIVNLVVSYVMDDELDFL